MGTKSCVNIELWEHRHDALNIIIPNKEIQERLKVCKNSHHHFTYNVWDKRGVPCEDTLVPPPYNKPNPLSPAHFYPKVRENSLVEQLKISSRDRAGIEFTGAISMFVCSDGLSSVKNRAIIVQC